MKHFIIIGIFLILSLVPVFGEQEFNKLVMLSNDSTHYIIADLVNIRAYPSTDAPIVGTARLCKPVKVWEMTDETDKLYGLEAHWYSVQVNEVNGYLWGGADQFAGSHCGF